MKSALAGLLLSSVFLAAAAQDAPPLTTSGPIQYSADAPVINVLHKAHSTNIDLRHLPYVAPKKHERPELDEPEGNPTLLPGTEGTPSAIEQVPGHSLSPVRSAPAPAPNVTFDGLDFATWGAGHPPDPNGDVGPNYYIETVNTAIGIYAKSNGAQVAAFTFDSLMSQGTFGNLCDTDNFGDPVVVYDTFEDRWVITDFAFTINGSGVVTSNVFQCFAVSKSGDPVTGGWNFYSFETSDNFPDYPKFGIWPDGIYQSANLFGPGTGGSGFVGTRVWAYNKAQMYSGAASVEVVMFNTPDAGDFTLLPSNARLQTGTPPTGTPNYFVSLEEFLNAQNVYAFHVDWTNTSLSTFELAGTPLASSSWANAASYPNIPTPANGLDPLQIRAMMQNQYTNIGGVESLWDTHGVRRTTTGSNVPRWYQLNVSGGTVAAADVQSANWDPDAANTFYRWTPSIAVDRNGDVALGYSKANATTNPQIRYAGRLAGDPVNTFSQTEQVLWDGTASQSGNCGTGACARWGDYSAMTLDPDGCTFWYVNEYYSSPNSLNDLTRIGSFSYPSCTPVGVGGSVSGTVVAAAGGAPLSGATVALGSRITTTDPSGSYSFTGLPAGTYPQITASEPGYASSTINSVVVSDGGTTTENFVLALAPTNGCFIDTTQADFGAGALTNLDDTSSPGDLILTSKTILTDQKEEQTAGSGFGFSNTSWAGQTFTAGITGQMSGADVLLFCSACSGANPDITLSVRASSGSGSTGLPTGADLAVATIPGFNDGGAGGYHAVTFSPPLAITAGTQYALVFRSNAARVTGVYAYTVSTGNPYTGGRRVTSVNSGGLWGFPAGAATSLDFHTYISIPRTYSNSGDFISSPKDSNAALGFASSWLNLAWTSATPANTSLLFQVAGSGSIFGPFNFVGPDGTASTFFTTSGPTLSQFNGDRYLKYRAYLTTSDTSVTPTLSDVSVCYTDLSLSPTSLEFDQEPTNAAAGATMSPAVTVRILDGFGNPVTTDNSSQVALSVASGPGTLTSGGGPVTVIGGTATFSNLVFSTAGTYTLSATSGVLTPATSTSFVISAGAASKLVYSQQPSNTSAAQPITPAITVAIEDSFGNVVTSSNASVALAIGTNAGGTGTVLSGGTAVAAVNGVATFAAASINKVGLGYTLVASSTGLASATSLPFNIALGPAAKLAFTTQPNNNANVASGAAINLVVQVQDAGGNVVTSDTSAVTVVIGNNPGGSTLSGTTTTNAVAGVATFTGLGLSLNKVGTGYTLVASDANAGVTSATSNAFNIIPGAAASLQIVQQPTDVVAGAIMTPAVTIRVFDANGNALTTSVTVVTLTIASGPSTTLFGGGAVNDSAGVATFNALSIHTAGTYTLTAASSGLPSVTSNPFVVSSGALSKLAFSMEPPATTTAGSAFPVTVQLQDQFSNVLTGDNSTSVALVLGANPGSDSYAGSSATANAGAATFSVTLMKVGSGYTLQASAGGKSVTSTAFDVTTGTESKLAFVTQPADVEQGTPLGAMSVEIEDGSGNRITSDSSTVVSLSISVCGGSVAVGSQTASGGLATFAAPASAFDFYTVASNLQIQASGTGLTAATSQVFNVTANSDMLFADGFDACRP
jgi:hypothetical protein